MARSSLPFFVAMGVIAAAVAASAALGLQSDGHELVAPGSVVLDAAPVEVRSGAGGTIAEVRVRDGDRVAAGDILMRLDDVTMRASLAEISRTADELTARRARLLAEQNKHSTVAFPDTISSRALHDTAVANLITDETNLFNLRQAVRAAEAQPLRERIDRLQEEIAAYGVQTAAKARELDLVMVQLKAARDLRAKSLIPTATLAGLEREAIRLEGERDGVLAATIAQAEGRVAETRFLMLQVERERSSEVTRELRDTETKLDEMVERKVGAENALHRLDVRAPEAGIVRLEPSRSIGVEVTSGDGLIKIAPAAERYAIDASIASSDIGALRVGQGVMVQLPGAGEGTRLAGTLSRIAPEDGGAAKELFYTARIALAPVDCTRLGPVPAGTQARVTLAANSRSVLSSFFDPVGKGLARALRAI